LTQLVENPFNAGNTLAPRESSGSRQMQSREMAETQAKYMMAQHFPRDVIANVDKIMNAFTRPNLAEKSQYQFARGGSDIVGPSIRAAEAIAQQWGNMEFGFRELSRNVGSDGVPYSEVEAFAVDLESRNRRPMQFIVKHWRDTKRGGYQLTDERDIYELVANQAQRRVRACILALIPGDVIDCAMNQAEVTLKSKADTSPEAMAKMAEAFAAWGVTKEHIEKRIQRRIDTIAPAQVIALKRIYASLRDDMSTPADWFEIEGTQATAKPKVEMPQARNQPQPPANATNATNSVTAATAAQPGPEPTAAASAKPATGETTPPPAKTKTVPTASSGASALATDGERKLIINRARTNSLDILDLIDQAGLAGMDPSLDGLTKDGFLALRDLLPKAA
jgi:hypothetical protein